MNNPVRIFAAVILFAISFGPPGFESQANAQPHLRKPQGIGFLDFGHMVTQKEYDAKYASSFPAVIRTRITNRSSGSKRVFLPRSRRPRTCPPS